MENEILNLITKISEHKSYPEIVLDSLTKDELDIIENVYVGQKGELTSVNQYIYQHIIYDFLDDLKDFNNCIEHIAISEMKHFEILGNILTKCNINPKFCKFIDSNPNICSYWSASFIDYSTTFKEALEKDLALENIAIREYKKLLEITKNDNLKDIITSILEDELLHIKFFEYYLNNEGK